MTLESLWEQIRVVGVICCDSVLADIVAEGVKGRAPFGAEVIFHSVRYGREDADSAFNVFFFVLTEGTRGAVAIGEDGTDQVANAGCYGCEAAATIPEAVIAGLVAEDEHEAHHYREGGDLWLVVSEMLFGDDNKNENQAYDATG